MAAEMPGAAADGAEIGPSSSSDDSYAPPSRLGASESSENPASAGRRGWEVDSFAAVAARRAAQPSSQHQQQEAQRGQGRGRHPRTATAVGQRRRRQEQGRTGQERKEKQRRGGEEGRRRWRRWALSLARSQIEGI